MLATPRLAQTWLQDRPPVPRVHEGGPGLPAGSRESGHTGVAQDCQPGAESRATRGWLRIASRDTGYTSGEEGVA